MLECGGIYIEEVGAIRLSFQRPAATELGAEPVAAVPKSVESSDEHAFSHLEFDRFGVGRWLSCWSRDGEGCGRVWRGHRVWLIS